jgi:RND family efflux transporter MFP subunit
VRVVKKEATRSQSREGTTRRTAGRGLAGVLEKTLRTAARKSPAPIDPPSLYACNTLGAVRLYGKSGPERLKAGGAVRASVQGLTFAALFLASCGEQNHYVAPPPAKVTVAPPAQRPITRYLDLTGSAAAVNFIDLVARVPGFVDSIGYQDGAFVKAGTPLFIIEPGPYDIKLAQAQAAVTGAQSTLNQAQADFDRVSALVASQTASKQQYDQLLASRDTAQSNLAQAQASAQLAKYNVDYAHVTAPFDGIVSAHQVSVGEYVGGSATPTELATIVQLDPIYVTFNFSEVEVERLRAELARRGFTREDLKKVPVEVGLQSETGYPHSGFMDYAAPTVNSTTGTLQGRAVFKNADRTLLPGAYVRVRIPVGENKDALLVPDAALGSDQTGRYLLGVNKEGVVEQLSVTVGPLVDGLRVIESGLKADDQVVVAGLQRAIPGQKVDPQPPAPSAPTPAPGATPATP